MARHTFTPGADDTVIAQGITIKGRLHATADIWLDCEVDGTIIADGAVTIAANARIIGDVKAGSIMVLGRVQGNLRARDRMVLQSTAVVTGDIKAAVVAVGEGANFNGTVKMTAATPTAPEDTPPEAE